MARLLLPRHALAVEDADQDNVKARAAGAVRIVVTDVDDDVARTHRTMNGASVAMGGEDEAQRLDSMMHE